jgi:arginase family enzyme
LKEQKIEVVFVSFDIDSIDPIDIPSTGTIAPNGIRKDKAK